MRLLFVAVATLSVVVACATNTRSRSARSDSVGNTPGCLDTLHAADSVTAVIKMSVASQDTSQRLPPDFEGMFAEEFRSHFKIPAHLPLSVVVGSPPCDSLGSRCAGGTLNMAAVAYATAHTDGKLSDIQVVDAALTPALADNVKSALNTMSEAGTVPLTGEVESIPLVIEIATEASADTIPPERRIFKARVPRYDIPFKYASMPATGVDARFPFTARLAGVGDSVTIAFTVDSNGMIATESLELLRATYRDFVSSVLDAIAKTHYHPAYLGDCPVATRMTQRFLFKAPD